MRYLVCGVDEIPPGAMRAHVVKQLPIVVVHSEQGHFYALYDRCPHQHVSLSKGILSGQTVATVPGESFHYTRGAELLRCPWHGFCFDVVTGTCIGAEKRLRVKTFPVVIENQQLFLDF